MSCKYQDCLKQVRAVCQSCLDNRYLCEEHMITHNSYAKHKITILEEDYLHKLFKKNLSSKIQNCISQITNDTNHMISALTKAAKNAIEFLKSLNGNLDSIRKFSQVLFDKKRVLFLIHNIELICTEMEIRPDYEIDKLLHESSFHRQNIESLTKEVIGLTLQTSQKEINIKDSKLNLAQKNISKKEELSHQPLKMQEAPVKPIPEPSDGHF